MLVCADLRGEMRRLTGESIERIAKAFRHPDAGLSVFTLWYHCLLFLQIHLLAV